MEVKVEDKQLNELLEIFTQIPTSSLDRVISILHSGKDRFEIIYALQSDFGFYASVNGIIRLISESKVQPVEIALVFESLKAYKKAIPQSKLSLVWSGPNLVGVPIRMTSQVILELIDDAKQSLFISSFSFYKIREVFLGLEKSIARGVNITLLLETPQSSHYKITHDPMGDFSEDFKSKVSFYIWPHKNRLIPGGDQTGSLHAKFILQDNQRLFITSANLTQYAMDRNIELGVIIEDKYVIEKLQDQLNALISSNVIKRI